MAALNFTKQNDRWYAEFTVTDAFNLHVEVEQGKYRSLRILQKSAADQEYDEAYREAPAPNREKAFDHDFTHEVYPKYIRVEVFSQPTKGTYTIKG